MSPKPVSTAQIADWIDTKAARIWPIYAPHSEHIRTFENAILWRVPVTGERLRAVTPEANAFKKFLRLYASTPEQVLAFAKRNGVLGLCEHGLPIGHSPRTPADVRRPLSRYCRWKDTGPRTRETIEPIESWRALSREAGALVSLKLSASGDSGPVLLPEHRDHLWKDAIWLCSQQHLRAGHAQYGVLVRERRPHNAERLRALLGRIVNEWLACSGVSLRLFASKDRLQFGLEVDSDVGPNLFGYLALQLAYTMADFGSLALCSACMRIYEPTSSAPMSTRRNFCDDCRECGRGRALNAKDYRTRKRTALHMRREGHSPQDIADTLRVKLKSVENWLQK